MRDADGFTDFYRRESKEVFLFLVRRTLDAELALEMTAETFAQALRSWDRLRTLNLNQARAWIFTVAQRQYSRYVRTAKVERRALQRLGIRVPTVHEDDLAWIEERVGLAQLRGVVRRELARLSDGQQEALRLRVIEERSYEEVAVALGVSEQTARARVSRGLRALLASLEPHALVEGDFHG